MPAVKLLRDYGYDELLAEAAPYLLREQPRDSKGRFDFGSGKAEPLSGSAALAAPPVDLAKMGNDPRAESLWYRTGDNSLDTPDGLPGFVGMNEQMRSGYMSPETKARVDDIDSVMRESQLSESIEVYRGIDYPSFIGEPGSLVGAEFHDEAFASTSTDRAYAEGFGTVVTVRVPAGTSAIRMADRDSKRPESEILLDRGLTFRVTGETHGTDDEGFSFTDEIQVEVVR